MTKRKHLMVLALVGLATTGCLDLEVTNPNAADAERALRTPGDIEALIAGGFSTWWDASSASTGPGPILMTMAYQHSATAANFGMVDFSGWPKIPTQSLPSQVFAPQNSQNAWTWIYRSVSAVVDGLNALDGGVTLPANDMARAQAFGYFVLGMAHGTSALLYDQGYVYDPSIDVEDVQLRPYPEVMAAALSYFDRAIQEAQGKTFTIPATWMSQEVTAQQLVRLAHSMKARYRTAVARTPTERAAVNWNAVAQDVQAGITDTWHINVASGSGFASGTLSNIHRYGPWGQVSYQVLGMADQSGQYQRWIARDPAERHPYLNANQTGDPFLIVTPDTRFPQGATIAAQTAAKGSLFEIPTLGGGFGAQWNRPDRGTFRWSFYRFRANDQWQAVATRTIHPEVTLDEMRLLRAEALFRTGNLAGAAELINVTRTAAGLNATNASGLNSSCVPRLPNGQCGNLLEMLKWEFRLQTMYYGTLLASWYFHGRGWGDLAEGSFLHIPVPGRELELLGLAPYAFGGPSGEASAPRGTYGY